MRSRRLWRGLVLCGAAMLSMTTMTVGMVAEAPATTAAPTPPPDAATGAWTQAKIAAWYLSRPDAFVARQWFDLTFAVEMRTLAFDMDFERGYTLAADTAGKHYHVVRGIRHTTNTPEHIIHTVYMLGGSTVFDLSVPDNYTLASYLQRAAPDGWSVVNAGMIATRLQNEAIRLRELPLRAGDVVLWIGGAWEARMIHDKAREQGADCAGVMQAVEVEAARNNLRLDEARTWAAGRGVRIVYVLEPSFWSMPVTAREQATNEDWQGNHDPCLAAADAAYYDRMLGAVNWRYVLDGLRAWGIPVYADLFHRTDAAYFMMTQAAKQALGW